MISGQIYVQVTERLKNKEKSLSVLRGASEILQKNTSQNARRRAVLDRFHCGLWPDVRACKVSEP